MNANVGQIQLALRLRTLVYRDNANADQIQSAQEYQILALILIANVAPTHSAMKSRIRVLQENVNVVAIPHVPCQGKYVFQDHALKVCTSTKNIVKKFLMEIEIS